MIGYAMNEYSHAALNAYTKHARNRVSSASPHKIDPDAVRRRAGIDCSGKSQIENRQVAEKGRSLSRLLPLLRRAAAQPGQERRW